MSIKLMKLRSRANQLERLFNQAPRVFRREDWEKLIADYEAIGAETNVFHWERKLANVDSLLKMEHTPMILGDKPLPQLPQARDAPEALMYWRTRKDM